MEHLDPWFNNDCVGEIERGKNREREKKAEEWKVNVCVCVRVRESVCAHTPDRNTQVERTSDVKERKDVKY